MSEPRWKSPQQSTCSSPSTASLEQLPAELLLHIVSFLDHRSFSCLRGVSTQFRRLTDSATPQLSAMLVCAVLRYTNQTWTSARELYNHLPDSNPASEDVSLLMQTLNDIDQHFRLLSLRPAFWPLRSFARLCGALHGHLREASGFTKELIYGRCELTENFAMLDICLRRDFCQIRAMFPTRLQPHDDDAGAIRLRSSGYEEPNMACLSSSSSPSSSTTTTTTTTTTSPPSSSVDELIRRPELLIGDDDARSAWVQAFGSQSVVDFDTFFNAVIVRRWPQAREHPAFEAYFRFYTNFPRDNIMTTYKWDAIVKQFGPCSHFFENFTQFGCGRGFLGPVNSVKADDILRCQPGYFILRVSRLEPERLTLSFCTKSSSGLKVLHRRKPHDLSIPQFVEKYLQSRTKTPFRPLRNQLDCSVASLQSFTDFLRCSQSFIRQLHARSKRLPSTTSSTALSSSVSPVDVARALS